VVEEPEKKTKGNAEQQASDNRKVQGGVFAAVHDVSRETAQTERKLDAEEEQRADCHSDGTENHERSAEFAKRIHEETSPGSRRQKPR
jgi:hypothetical protein